MYQPTWFVVNNDPNLSMDNLQALKSHDFCLLLFGHFISRTATQTQQVALTWHIYLLTHSPLALGLLALFRFLPILIFTLGGGVIADALNRRMLLLVIQSWLACTSFALGLATVMGLASANMIYVITFLSGAAAAFEIPARQAFFPLILPSNHLPSAVLLMMMAMQIAAVIGPSIGGIALAQFGAGSVYCATGASSIAVILALLFLKHRGAATAPSTISFKAVAEGFLFLRKSSVILSTMLLDFVASLFGCSAVLMPIFANELLNIGPEGLGFLYAAQSVGAVVAAATMSLLPTIRRQGVAQLLSLGFYGAAIVGFGVSRWPWLSLLLLAIAGAAATVSAVIRGIIRQRLTPDHLRGRMFSMTMIFYVGGPQLGDLEAGMVANWVGARFAVISGGALCLLAVIASAIVVPSIRRYTDSSAR